MKPSQLLNDDMDPRVEREDSAAVVPVEDEVTAREEDLAGGGHGGGSGEAVRHGGHLGGDIRFSLPLGSAVVMKGHK